ncbi:unnamed protein product [Pleuronectes platessa]|uniref:Uncharacterized protein n=1 Tax=Pleuronectes platessa TaxID=8262 RepID=A0A9N7TS54_PLEPL|nr:unnamed protein product [Pleuronectes platessa]
MWCEQGADEKAWPAPKSLPLPSVRAQAWKAGGHNIVEQISSNLSVLVRGLRREDCSPVPSPPVPRISPVYPSQCQHTARRMKCRRGVRAAGISAFTQTAHVCSQQARALPWRKELSGEELAQGWPDPTCTLTATAQRGMVAESSPFRTLQASLINHKNEAQLVDPRLPPLTQGKCGIVPPRQSPSGCEWPSNQALPFTAAGLQRAAGLTSEGPASPLPVLWDPSTSFRGQMRYVRPARGRHRASDESRC